MGCFRVPASENANRPFNRHTGRAHSNILITRVRIICTTLIKPTGKGGHEVFADDDDNDNNDDDDADNVAYDQSDMFYILTFIYNIRHTDTCKCRHGAGATEQNCW